MGKCIDCKIETLTDDVCSRCSDKRFWDYPRLRELEIKLKETIDLYRYGINKVPIEVLDAILNDIAKETVNHK